MIGGKVEGRVALIFDDMISTAGSICGAAEVMHQHGARQIYLAATHGLLVGGAIERLQKAPIDGLVLTDTIPLPRREADPEAHGVQRRPPVGRGHQADPPQRIGEPAVCVRRCIDADVAKDPCSTANTAEPARLLVLRQ